MNNITGIEWLEENSYRAYPLTSASNATVQLGAATVNFKTILLDANFSYIATMPDTVLLERVTRFGNTVTITVTGLPNFVIDLSTATFPYYCYNSNFDLLTVSADIANVPDPTEVTFSDVSFEPSIAIELTGEYQGVNHVDFNGSVASAGDISIDGGFQTSVVVNGQTIVIEVGRNRGEPLPCQDFFNPSNLTSDCSNVVSFLNGASPLKSGGTIRIVAGANVKVYEDPELNRIYVGLDFTSQENCVTSQLPPAPNTII